MGRVHCAGRSGSNLHSVGGGYMGYELGLDCMFNQSLGTPETSVAWSPGQYIILYCVLYSIPHSTHLNAAQICGTLCNVRIK